MSVSKQEQNEAIARLRETLKPGNTLYTILRSVSRSGMSRVLDVYCIEDNQPVCLSGWVVSALGWIRTNNGIRANGCGMDAGFHLVHELSYALFPDFDRIGDHCPSNDRNNASYYFTKEGKEIPHHHTSDGYALKQQWL